jgi:hypothetical protein
MRVILTIMLLTASASSFADWHVGNIKHLGIGYDGTTVTVSVEGWSRNNCTCYPTWPTYMCLDKNRPTHEFEKALILAARARNSVLKIHIDEVTCKVVAIYEDDA